MIILPLFFSILVILPAPTNQQGPPPSPTTSSSLSKVDWTQCAEEANCFCVEAANPLELKGKFKSVPATPHPNNDESTEGLCNIGVQNKYLTDEYAVFQLQVIGNSHDIDNNPELMLYRREIDADDIKDVKVFGCKLNSKNRSVEVVGDTELLNTYKISLFENRSYFESGNVLCALKIENPASLATKIDTDAKFKNKNTIMKLLNFEYKHDLPTKALFDKRGGQPRCNPYFFTDMEESPNYYVQPIMDRDRENLDCAYYKSSSSSYIMRYDEKDKERGLEMIRLECRKVPEREDEYMYHIVFTDNMVPSATTLNAGDPPPVLVKEISDVPVTNPEFFTFYCAANIDETCENPNSCEPGPTCPVFHPGSKGHPAKLTCARNRWLIDGKYLELAADPVCKRDRMASKNGVAFYFKPPSGSSGVKQETRCFEDYDCKVYSKHMLPKCVGGDEETCGAVDDSNGILKCKDDTKRLTVNSMDGTNLNWTLSGYKCNLNTGHYFNDTVVLPLQSRVRCIGDPPPKKRAAPKFSDGQVTLIICGAFAVVVVIIVAGFSAYYFICVNTGKKVRKGAKKNWMKMKKADRIEKCKKDFAIVMSAKCKYAMVILAGLDRLELLLDAEIVDPECWEEVYKFLKRLQGAIMMVDKKLFDLFSYYMYTLAKHIINIHGWTTKERITKNNQKGLIRSVAIRLLSIAMNNPKCTEPQELIVAGYNELGFDAVEQYPHCGLMWSVIMHDRSGWFEHKTRTEEEKRKFLCTQFMKNMMKIAGDAKMVIPEDDVIPVYGTPVEQAAFAIGGSTNIIFLFVHSKTVMEKLNNANQGAVARSCLKGMGDVLHRNSLQVMMDVFEMGKPKTKKPKKDPKKEDGRMKKEDLWKIVPQSMCNEILFNAAKGQIDYGLNLEATTLHRRLIPDRPSDELIDVETEQKYFLEAVEKVKEELRAWFAQRTDKEELKKKPVYIVNPRVKLDNLVDSVSNVESKGKDPVASDNKSVTQSSGHSNTNTEQAPKQTASDPTDAAAPSAAAAAVEPPAAPKP